MKLLFGILGACLSAALLTACVGGINDGFSSATPLLGAPLGTHSKTFNYTGAEQTLKVPKGVTRLTAAVSGAVGSHGYYGTGGGAAGGLVTATIPVTPGESIAVFVGGAGGSRRRLQRRRQQWLPRLLRWRRWRSLGPASRR